MEQKRPAKTVDETPMIDKQRHFAAELRLDEPWDAESDQFRTAEPISPRAERARLPVAAHRHRSRPALETRACQKARHRISQRGGMHRRRRKRPR